MRPVPRREDLLALRRVAAGALRLRLTRLDETAVATLVTSRVGGKPDDKLLRLADGAAGNPLYVIELVDALARSSSVTVTGAGTAVLTNGSAPGSLSAAIADRLGFVSGPVREMLRAAALLGVDFAVPDLAVVLGRGVADLVPALDEARAAGVLAESGGGLGFRHPLIRTALYEEIPVPVRAAWHRDAGRALAEAGAPADRVARQLLQALGGPGGPVDPMDDWMLSLAGSHRGSAGRPGAPGGGGTPPAGLSRVPPLAQQHHDFLVSRLADALYRVGDAAEAEQVVNRGAGADAVEPDLTRRPALDAGAVPDAGRQVRRVARHPGTKPWLRRGSPPSTARGCWCSPRAPHSNRGDVETARPGRRDRAGGGVGGGRQLGDGLGTARADDRDRGAGADDRCAAAVRAGTDRHRG